jgi:hypothetical protein
MRILVAGLGTAVLLLPGTMAFAQDKGAEDHPISNLEYDKLEKEIQSLKAEVESLRKEKAPGGGKEKPSAGEDQSDLSKEIDELIAKDKALAESINALRPGTTHFLLSGYAFAGFTAEQGTPSNFTARLNPIFLWELNDRAAFEGELEFELTPEGTEVGLEESQLTYLLTDHVTLCGGKFLTPFGTFGERGHPMWINKLPDFPFFFGDGGLVPEASIGFMARGPFEAGSTKGNYALFVANGALLNTGDGAPEEAGTLDFDNRVDTNHNKEVGGRIGFLPIPEIEIGGSIEAGRASTAVPSTLGEPAYRLYALDLAWTRDSEALSGAVDVRAQWVRSHVDRTTYDPTGSLGFGPLDFSNNRQAGYLQVAYRPSKASSPFLKDLEGVVRYDYISQPSGAPLSIDQRRWTVGLVYWLGPSTAFKLAYERSDRNGPPGTTRNVQTLLFQFVMGF